MVELKLSVPTSLNEITLNQYMAYAALPEGLSDEARSIRALNIFLGITRNQCNMMRRTDLQLLISKLNVVLDMNPDFYQRFEHNGQEWGFIPNLDNITMGEFVDLDSQKDYKKDLAKLMSVLYRPIKSTLNKTYEIEVYDARNQYHKILEKMPAGIALGALVFFWAIGNDCLNATLSYTESRKTQRKASKGSVKSGDGMDTFITYAEVILRNLKTSLKGLTMSAYYGLPMNPTWRLHIKANKYVKPQNKTI